MSPEVRAGCFQLTLCCVAGVCLHGGATGLDTVEWARISVENSTLFSQSDIAQGASASAIYRYVSSDGDDGFPLGLEVEGLSTVSPGQGGSAGKVTVVLRAKIIEEGADEEALNKGTPVNLTVHWGFNLSDFSTEDVKDHKMYINVSLRLSGDFRCSALSLLPV